MRINILALVQQNFSPSKVNLEQFCDLVKYLLKVRITLKMININAVVFASTMNIDIN